MKKKKKRHAWRLAATTELMSLEGPGETQATRRCNPDFECAMPTGIQALARFLRANAIARSFPLFPHSLLTFFCFSAPPPPPPLLAFTIRTGIHGPTTMTMTSNLSKIFHSLSFPLHLELGTLAINFPCNLTSIVLRYKYAYIPGSTRYASDTVVGNSENLEGWCRKLIGSSREHNWNSRETLLGLVKSRSKVARGAAKREVRENGP